MEKMKTSRKIIIAVMFIIILIFLIIICKFNILTKIQERNKSSNQKTNCYYLSETDETIMEYWRKDNIMKMNIRQTKKDGNITFWKDSYTGEELTFWNAQEKKYAKTVGSMISSLPASMTTIDEDKFRFLISADPMLLISKTKYEEKSCYHIKFHEQEEIIEKATGLILYSNMGQERKITYRFDDITDEEVQKPNIAEYELVDETSTE